VICASSFQDLHETLPSVLSNPPFGLRLPLSVLHGRTVISELRFLTWWMDHAPPSGRCGLIVPDGILFREERAFREARERLLTDFAVIAVVRLPVGTFSGAPDVRTNMVFIRRDVQSDTIRYYQVPRATGPSLRANLPSDALEGALAERLNLRHLAAPRSPPRPATATNRKTPPAS
jgi:N-6 DNA Methylase